MKKIIPILIAAVVLFGCIFAAGCVNEPATVEEPSVEDIEPAYSVTVKTSGMDTYSTGDIFALQFVSNPSTGYQWIVTEGSEILYSELKHASLHLDEPLADLKPRTDSPAVAISPDKKSDEASQAVSIGGSSEPAGAEMIAGAASTQTFWFQPSKAGDYKITLKYMRSWEGEDSAISTYSQTLHVVDSNEPSPNGAKTEYVFDSFEINPAAGEYVKVIKTANPTTGYFWEVSGEGLNILTDYKVANPELVGSSGQYEWYASAEKAGDYVFKAVYKHAGSDEVLSYFEIPLKFV